MIRYSTAHNRVTEARGPARRFRCACCGVRPAAHWSYDHSDPNEAYSSQGWPYSEDPARYRQLCVPCHKRADLAHIGRGEPCHHDTPKASAAA